MLKMLKMLNILKALHPFRLLIQDFRGLRQRYASDWTTFNQLIVASAVYLFFTNLLPGITFASDLYVLTGQSWGTIEVVLSTGLCGILFSLCVKSLSLPNRLCAFIFLRLVYIWSIQLFSSVLTLSLDRRMGLWKFQRLDVVSFFLSYMLCT